MSLASPTIVISPDFLPELKKLPDATLSMEAAVDEVRRPGWHILLTHLTMSIVNGD
jgi:hypothetical protein